MVGRTIAICALLVAPCVANACSCMRPEMPAVLERSSLVFSGNVTKVVALDDAPEPGIEVSFSVSQVWKGEPGASPTIRTIHNRRSCNGYFFKEGESYLVAVGVE